jgi:hypothetical protein
MNAGSAWLTTTTPTLFFENNPVGWLEWEIWEVSDEAIDTILADHGIPSPSKLGKLGTYIQSTVQHKLIENRRKNDIVCILVGSTECYGDHTVSGFDTLLATQIPEAARRVTARAGHPANLVWPPINYGVDPYRHVGVPGTVIREKEVLSGH